MPPTAPEQTGPRVTSTGIRDVSSLRRARHDRLIAGVAGGVARHLDVDPLIVRVLFGVATIFGGAGLVAYAILWLAVPEDGATGSVHFAWRQRDPRRITQLGVIFAITIPLAIVLGGVGWFGPGPHGFVLVMLVALGILALLVRSKSPYEPNASADAPTSAVPGSVAGSADPAPASRPDADSPADSRDDKSPTVEDAPAVPTDTGMSTLVQAPVDRRPPRARRPRSHLFAITVAFALLGCGVAAAYDIDHRVAPSIYPGIVLSAAGLGLLAGTWLGRSRLLIPLGVAAGVATLALSVIDHGPFGEVVYRPTTAADVKETYQLGAGRLVIDLRGLSAAQLERLDGRTIHVDASVGQVQIRTPRAIDTSITAHVSGGQITGLTAHDVSGDDVSARLTPVDTRAPDLTIDVGLKYGEILASTNCTTPKDRLDVQTCQ